MKIAGVPQNGQAWIGKDAVVSRVAQNWLETMRDGVNASAQKAGSSAEAASAAIASTEIPITAVVDGLYRVTSILQVVTPASVSSSLTFTLTWTNPQGIVCTKSGAALTANATGVPQDNVWAVNTLAGTTINYDVAYASVGTPMAYTVVVTVEAQP